jgi:hypothetical protein
MRFTSAIRRVAAALAVTLVLLPAIAPADRVDRAYAVPEFPDVASAALLWMRGQQQQDGSFPGFGAGSTVDALLAIVAARQDPASYSRNGNTPVTFLESKAAEIAKTPGGAGKLLIAVAALGRDGRAFGGVNLVDAITTSYNADTGQYGKDVIGHAFAVLGLEAAGEQVPDKATAFLAGTQTPEGGWAFSGDTKAGTADTNTTAVVVQALVAVGADKSNPDLMKKAVSYLTSQQNPDGGFPYQKGGEFGSESDVNSTAYVAQAMLALGNNTVAGQARSFIRSMQNPSGAFRWKPSEPADNAGATYQAIPPLLGATMVSPVGTEPVFVPEGSPPVSQPGMPRTGGVQPAGSPWTPWGTPWAPAQPAALSLVAAIAVVVLGMGVMLRQRARR